MSSITPTIGRKVWYYDHSYDHVVYSEHTPFDATIVYVWSPTCVNLRISDHVGTDFVRTSVLLKDPSEGDRHHGPEFATWMPCQVKTAEKADTPIPPPGAQ